MSQFELGGSQPERARRPAELPKPPQEGFPGKTPEDRVLKTPEQEEDREIVPSLKVAGEMIKERMLDRLFERFSQTGKTPLEYHGPMHSLEVGETVGRFLETVRAIDPELVSEMDVVIGRAEGIAHDLVQEADFPENKDRKRKTGENEQSSAEELVEELKRYHYADGRSVFPETPEFEERIRTEIGTTEPVGSFDKLPDGSMGLRIAQKNLSEKSSLVALALASADLRMEYVKGKNPESFFASGNAEFRESKDTIKKDIEGGIENIPPARRAEITKTVLEWKKMQIGFAKWQKELFHDSIENNETLAGSSKAAEIRAALTEMFSNFDPVIQATETLSQHLSRQYEDLQNEEEHKRLMEAGDDSFRKLLGEMGYSV